MTAKLFTPSDRFFFYSSVVYFFSHSNAASESSNTVDELAVSVVCTTNTDYRPALRLQEILNTALTRVQWSN